MPGRLVPTMTDSGQAAVGWDSTDVDCAGIFGCCGMVGGAILVVCGVVAALHSRSTGDRGGLSKPLAIMGMALFFIGAFLDNGWGVPW